MQSSNAGLCRPSARTVLILYLSFSACTSWRPDKLTPQAVVQKAPPSLRVTYRDSSMVTLNNPQLRGDTIVGRDPHKAQQRVPLDSVLLTETRHTNAGKSALLVLGVAAAVVAGAALAYVLGCPSDPSCSNMQPGSLPR